MNEMAPPWKTTAGPLSLVHKYCLIGKTVSEVIFMHKHVPDRPIEKDELPVPEEIYPVIDNDLARDNIENDIPAADLEDLLPKARGGDWNGK